MTRKDFELIAATLKASKHRTPGASPELSQWRTTVDAFADMCAKQNPGFKRDRFLKACGAV